MKTHRKENTQIERKEWQTNIKRHTKTYEDRKSNTLLYKDKERN
jgi:hypothetical protein